MVTRQKEYFKNTKTWKQITTNVPPDMHKALKARVTREYTMSQLIRELVAESEVMRGGYPQPKWSVELSKEMTELRQEVTELRAEARATKVLAETNAKVARGKEAKAKVMDLLDERAESLLPDYKAYAETKTKNEEDPMAKLYEYPPVLMEEDSTDTKTTDEEKRFATWDEWPADLLMPKDEPVSIASATGLPVELEPAAKEEEVEQPAPAADIAEPREKPVKRKPFAFLDKLPKKLGFGRKSA